MLSRIRQYFGRETKAATSPDPWTFELFGAQPSAAGIVVSAHSAMQCAAFARGVNLICEAIGTLPLAIYRRLPDGSKQRADGHPAYRILHDVSNDWQSASLMRETVQRHALTQPHGGFAYIGRADVEDRPVEIVPLEPGTVSVDYDAVTGQPSYKINGRQVDASSVLHIPSPTRAGIVREARESIALALILEKCASQLFSNGARPSGVLSLKNNPSPAALQMAGDAWRAAHGNGKSGGTAVLPADATWQALVLSSVDAQFLEMRRFATEEIGRHLGCPPHMLYEMGAATWANTSEMARQFLQFSLAPWLKRWTGEIQLKLLDPNHFAEFVVDDFVRTDIAARATAYSQFRSAGIFTSNEIRAMENRPPLPGGNSLESPHVQSGAAAA